MNGSSQTSCPTPITLSRPQTPTWSPSLTLALLTLTARGSFGVTGGAAGSWLCSQLPGLIGSGAGVVLASRGRWPAGRGRALGSHVLPCPAQCGLWAQHLSPALSAGQRTAPAPTRLSDSWVVLCSETWPICLLFQIHEMGTVQICSIGMSCPQFPLQTPHHGPQYSASPLPSSPLALSSLITLATGSSLLFLQIFSHDPV